MQIRAAVPADAGGIARLQVGSYQTAYAGLLPAAYLAGFSVAQETQDWVGLIESGSKDILLVAEWQPGIIAGYALGRAGRGEILPYDAELVALHVARLYQGRGVGGTLLKEIARQLQEGGCQSLMLWTLSENPRRAWYEKLGGVLVGEKAWGGNEYFNAAVKEVAYGWLDIAQLAGWNPGRSS